MAEQRTRRFEGFGGDQVATQQLFGMHRRARRIGKRTQIETNQPQPELVHLAGGCEIRLPQLLLQECRELAVFFMDHGAFVVHGASPRAEPSRSTSFSASSKNA